MAGDFLQSSEWEEAQKSLGRKVWRVGELLLIRHNLSAGFNYLYCPRPKLVTGNWLLNSEEIAREEKSIFLKIDPAVQLLVTGYQLRATNSLQPRKTVLIDLQKSEEELLRSMHEKTRYNIRLAERRGVVVAPVAEPTAADMFIWWSMLSSTAERDGFHAHERAYYEKLVRTRSEEFSNELFLADCNMTTLAGAVVNFYWPARTATYLHGASSRANKEVMAPHLLHWRIMQEAKRRGFHYYDLWGTDDKKWPGLTRFKIGFGGEKFEYPESFDIVYRPLLYGWYKLARRIRG